MLDAQKYLDFEGVKYLWSKINMQDYPNNKTLVSVINAIDETKADKTELVQAEKAVGEAITNLNNLVGETKVSEQISNAIAQKSQVQIITWEADD